jgi:hypothetical protein
MWACFTCVTTARAASVDSGSSGDVRQEDQLRATWKHVVSEAIRARLPRYDPEARKAPKMPDEKSPLSATVTPGNSGVTESASSRSTDSETAKSPLLLPRMVVSPTVKLPDAPAPLRLPRIVVHAPPDTEKPRLFESEDARNRRLIKKHLSPLDRLVLNRFAAKSNQKRARNAEAIEQSAKILNEVGDLLEFTASTEEQTEKDRDLKDAYFDAFVSRPK